VTKKGTGKREILFSVSLLSVVVTFLGVQGTYQAIASSPHFLVKEIDLVWPKEFSRPVERYRMNPAASIFRVDLTALAAILARQDPAAEVISIRRVLPNRLTATMQLKRPVAQLRTWDRYYPVSPEGRILLAGQPAPLAHLPILFMEGTRRSYRLGETFEHPKFPSACKLLQGVLRQGGIARRTINSVRSRGEDLILLLDSGLEIRFNSGRLESEWFRLGDLITQKPEMLDRAQYIDLRFGNPVIGGMKKGKGSK